MRCLSAGACCFAVLGRRHTAAIAAGCGLMILQQVGAALSANRFMLAPPLGREKPAAWAASPVKPCWKASNESSLRVSAFTSSAISVVVLGGNRAEPVPIEPFVGDVAHVAEVARAQRGHGEQFREQRLARVVGAGEGIESAAPPATAGSAAAGPPGRPPRAAEVRRAATPCSGHRAIPSGSTRRSCWWPIWQNHLANVSLSSWAR